MLFACHLFKVAGNAGISVRVAGRAKREIGADCTDRARFLSLVRVAGSVNREAGADCTDRTDMGCPPSVVSKGGR